MITTEKARHAVETYSDEQLRALVPEILAGGGHLPTPWRSGDLEPVEVLITLLREPNAPRRKPVLDGTRRFLLNVTKFLFDRTRPLTEEMRQALDHFSTLISLAAPAELKGITQTLVALAIKHPAIDSELRASLVRAAMTFAAPGEDPDLWKRCLSDPALAAYGFEALLRIDPTAPTIDTALGALWEGYLSGKNHLLVAALTRRTAELRGSDAFLSPLFSTLLSEHPELTETLRGECERNSYSKEWVRWAQPPKAGIECGDYTPTDDRSIEIETWLAQEIKSALDWNDF